MKEALEKARAALNTGRAADCIEILTNAINRGGACEPDMQRALACSLLASAQWETGSRVEAIGYWQKAVAQIQALKDSRLKNVEAGYLCNLSHAFKETGNLADALEAGLKAVETARPLRESNPNALAFALFILSSAWYSLKDLDKAEETVREARELWENAGNLEKVATCMNNLGRIYEERGENAEGIRWHEKAVAMRRNLSCEEDLAFSLGNLGVARAAAGQWHEAKENLTESLQIYQRLGKEDSPEAQILRANLDLIEKAIKSDD